MSDRLQLGQHPDADQLNAFVEHTLPAHEQKQTLAHLAKCADCRKIVALSLPPIEEPPVVSPEPEPEPGAAPVFGGWFSGWRLAWIAAPALAAIFLLTVHLHTTMNKGRGRATPPAQVAEVRKPSQEAAIQKQDKPAVAKAPRVQPALPAPSTPKALKPRSDSTAKRAARPAAESDRFAVKKLQPQPGVSIGEPVIVNGQMAGMPSGTGAVPKHPASNGISGFLKPPPSAAASQPAPAPKAPYRSANEAATSAASDAISAPEAPTVIVAEKAMPATRVSRSESPLAITRPTSKLNAFRKNTVISIQAALPSGLPILSFAAHLQQRIAIDTGNQLFFSEDGGQDWKAVPSPWRGRAIAVATTDVSRIAPASTDTQPMGLAVPERFTPGETAVMESGTISDSLSGTITDAAGAVISRATIAMTDSRTASVRSVETDSGGRYLVSNFVPGLYRLNVQAPGFLKQILLVDLSSSPEAVRNIVLDVGNVSEAVTVEAATEPLDMQSASISQAATKKTKQVMVHPTAGQMNQPPIFVVTTDAGERWTTSDGQSWKHE